MSNTMDRFKANDHEREPVPMEDRKGWLQLSLVWLGIAIALSATVLGGTLGGGLSLPQAITASLIGSLILAIVCAFTSVVGAKTGLSTGMIATFSLGRYGSYAVSIVIAIALFGWFGVQLDLFGASLDNVLQNVFGITVNKTILVIFGGIAMTFTAVIGYKAIEKLSLAAVPLMVILLIASLWKTLGSTSFSELTNAPLFGDTLQIGGAVSLVIGSFATGSVIGPDIARYAKSSKDAVIAAFFGFLIGFSAVLIIAAMLAKATAETDIVNIMLGLGWGTFAMIILILAQWTTNDNNLYSAALGFSVIFQKIPKYQLSIVAGAIGTILAVAGIYDSFIPFLNFLSALIPPIGGLYVADYLLNKSKYTFDKINQMRMIEPIGVTSWLLASGFAFLTMAPPTGFGLFSVTGSSGADALIAAFIIQVVLTFIFNKNR